jgi:hypothetical protein
MGIYVRACVDFWIVFERWVGGGGPVFGPALRPSPHAAMGATVLALICAQLLLGGLVHWVPRAQTYGPPLHRWNGRLLYALALVNLFLGAVEYNSNVYILGILGLWFGMYVLLVVTAKVRHTSTCASTYTEREKHTQRVTCW